MARNLATANLVCRSGCSQNDGEHPNMMTSAASSLIAAGASRSAASGISEGSPRSALHSHAFA